MRRLALAGLLTVVSAAVHAGVSPRSEAEPEPRPFLAFDLVPAAPLLTVVSRRTIFAASYIPVPAPQPLQPALTLVVENGSPWERPGRLEGVLGKTSAIFAQCGVSLGATEVLSVRWSAEGLLRLNTANPYAGPPEMYVMYEPQLPAARPLGFLFAENSIPSTARADNRSTVDRYLRQFPQAAAILNTFWITSDQELRGRRRDETAAFSVTAHELAHLFGNLDHTSDVPNLMTEVESRGAKSGDLTPAQCAEIVKLHGLAVP